MSRPSDTAINVNSGGSGWVASRCRLAIAMGDIRKFGILRRNITHLSQLLLVVTIVPITHLLVALVLVVKKGTSRGSSSCSKHVCHAAGVRSGHL